MTGFKEELFLGALKLKSNIFMAPMAGCTDFPLRKVYRAFPFGLLFCEMVKMEALTRGVRKTFEYLDFNEEMRPIGAQLVGANSKIAGKAAKMIEDMGFDLIDFNCGCPVDKVVKDGSGAALLKDVSQIGEILSEIISAVKIPVTLKIRAGWNEGESKTKEVTSLAEAVGAKAITVHGRSRQQKYKGVSDWSQIKAAKEVAVNIKVIGNGDVFSASDAKRMFAETRCDGVMLARGALGKPWLCEEIKNLYFDKETSFDGLQIFKRHLEAALSWANGKKQLLDLKRISFWYLKNFKNAKILRSLIAKASKPLEIMEIITAYDGNEGLL